jgi:hypothetical protein
MMAEWFQTIKPRGRAISHYLPTFSRTQSPDGSSKWMKERVPGSPLYNTNQG